MIAVSQKKRFSLTIKLFIMVAFVLLLNLVLVWGFGRFYLEDFYAKEKQNQITDAFSTLKLNQSIIIDELKNADDTGDVISQIENQNIRITLAVVAKNTIYSVYTTLSKVSQTEARPFPRVYPVTGALSRFPQMISVLTLDDYRFVDFPDDALESDQLRLFGRLGDDMYVLLETPLEPISESAALATRFSLLTGFIAFAAGILITIILSTLLTKPLRQMTSVAKRLAEHDFSERVYVNTSDEIGELGVSINSMSDSLQSYTNEITAVNQQLKLDIEERMLAEQAQKQLVSNISHELKTPLSIISGYAEGLRSGIVSDDEMRNEYCDIIIDESKNMTHMIQNLLRLAKLQSGKSTPIYSDINLSVMTDTQLNSFSLMSDQRNVTIIRDYEENEYVNADKDSCEQVLRNYLSNALRHVNDAGTIKVSFVHKGNNLRIEVYNTGSHIDENDLERIWDSFYRSDSARSRDSGGNGLGLSIVRAHMQMHSMPFGVMNCVDGVMFFAEFKSC